MERQLDLFTKASGRTSILMASGFAFDLAHPDATGMKVSDIGRALASIPRWCGATREYYSVAEHSVMVSCICSPADAYNALFHDSLEVITGDWPSPLKLYLGRDNINTLLEPLEAALRRRFSFLSHLATVKEADLIAMATELRDLLPPAWMDWGHLPAPHPEVIRPIGTEAAYRAFMARYEEVKHLAVTRPAPAVRARRTA